MMSAAHPLSSIGTSPLQKYENSEYLNYPEIHMLKADTGATPNNAVRILYKQYRITKVRTKQIHSHH
jgi:hypothetical protein